MKIVRERRVDFEITPDGGTITKVQMAIGKCECGQNVLLTGATVNLCECGKGYDVHGDPVSINRGSTLNDY